MATFKKFIQSIQADGNDGKAFERFCKHFLETAPPYNHLFEQVWMFDEWPEKWFRIDKGTDLIAKYKNGKYCAIQAKCFAEDNHIPYDEISKFLADSSREIIQDRILMASTDRIGETSDESIDNQLVPVQKLMLNYFESINYDYPSHILELSTAVQKPKPKPLPHQVAAISDVISKFKEHERGQLIMACGTGKTFTTLWIKEELLSQTTLVLVPTLNLLSQTFKEWVFAAKTKFDVLCVCSDPSVIKKTDDDIFIGDVSFRVDSDPNTIADFMRGDGNKVIFCTYSSSKLLEEVQLDKTIKPFDLVIADEAHRCAGEADTLFSKVLDGNVIRAKKRLFTTATPRLSTSNYKKAAADRSIKVYGMDDEAVFGPEFHKYSFAQAINDGELIDYQVVIIGVDDPMIKQWIVDQEILTLGPDYKTEARTLAAKIGLLKGIKRYNLKRVISFHNKVDAARNFASEVSKLVDLIEPRNRPLGSLWASDVRGTMSVANRLAEIRKLKNLDNVDIGILANAKCLSEGVDIPTLDGVAFIDPKSSQTDIIQSVGRAIRKVRGAETQKLGIIVLPVFIENGDDPEAEIQASNFKPVWDVLNALRDHDEVLGDYLDQYRTNIAKTSGKRSLKWTDKIIFDLPKTLGSNFSSSLRTVLVETTTASWEFWYGLLETYVEQKAHARVPAKYKTEDANKYHLGVWCETQRRHYQSNQLTKARLLKLQLFETVGWVWSLKDSQREYNIARLKEFYLREHHSIVKDRQIESDGFDLGNKVRGFVTAYQNGTLEKKWIEYLEKELYFKWDITMFWWLAQYAALRRWARQNKNSSPPRTTTAEIRVAPNTYETRNISHFRNSLVISYSYWELEGGKAKYKQKNPPIRLSKRQLAAVKKIPFWTWNALDARWFSKYSALLEFNKREGNPHVPANKHIEIMPDGSKHDLSRWMRKQRTRYGDGTLETDKIEKLNKLKFDWTGELAPKVRKFKLDDEDFEERFRVLERYVSEQGHAIIKQDLIFDGHKLGSWVSRWRQAYMGKEGNRAELTPQIIKRLETVHPTWLWAAADSREGVALPFSDEFALSLLQQKKEHELHNLIEYGLYCGLRLFDAKTFEIVNIHGIFCFKINARTGYQERFVPIPRHLKAFPNLQTSTGNLGNMFRRLPIWNANTEKKLFFSLHLTFRQKLKKLGLNNELINGLSGWNPRMDWNEQNLKKCKKCIDKVSYK